MQRYLCKSCQSLHNYIWALALLKKGVMFSDDKNWFPISSTMTASFPATQAIWPTLLRLPGAVDQGDSCLHLRPLSLRSQRERLTLRLSVDGASITLVISCRESRICTCFLMNWNKCAFAFVWGLTAFTRLIHSAAFCCSIYIICFLNVLLAQILLVYIFTWYVYDV